MFSPHLRSVLSSIQSATSSSAVISFPDVSSSLLEQALQILSKSWQEKVVTISADMGQAFVDLGIDVGHSVNKKLSKTIGNGNIISETKVANEAPNHENVNFDKTFKCNHCERTFDSTSAETMAKIAIHLGKVHFEKETQVEQSKLFPVDSNKCKDCGNKFVG